MNRRFLVTTITVLTAGLVVTRIIAGMKPSSVITYLFDLFFLALFITLLVKVRPAKNKGYESSRFIFGVPLFAFAVICAFLIERLVDSQIGSNASLLWLHLARAFPLFAFSWSALSVVRLGETEINKIRRRIIIAVIIATFIAILNTPPIITMLFAVYVGIWVIPSKWIETLDKKERRWLIGILITVPFAVAWYYNAGIVIREFLHSNLVQINDHSPVSGDNRGDLVSMLGLSLSFHWLFLGSRIVITGLQGKLGWRVPITVKLVLTYILSTIIPGLLLLSLVSISGFVGIGALRSNSVGNLINADLKEMEEILLQGKWEIFVEKDSIAVGLYTRKPVISSSANSNITNEDNELSQNDSTDSDDKPGSLSFSLSDDTTGQYGEDLKEFWELKKNFTGTWEIPLVLPALPGWSETTLIHSGILPTGDGKTAFAATVRYAGRKDDILVVLQRLTPSILDKYREIIGADIILQPNSGFFGIEDTDELITSKDIPGVSNRIFDISHFAMDHVSTTRLDTNNKNVWSRSLYHGVSELRIDDKDSTTQSRSVGVIVVRSSIKQVLSVIFETRGLNIIVLIILGILTGLLILAVLVSNTLGLGIMRTITSAISKLRKGTESLRKGDLDQKIVLKNHDELGDLADSFNQMTADLRRMLKETAEKERLQQEIQIARQIQENLLPGELPLLDNYEFAALSNPSHDVGGDYYDVFIMPDGRVGIAIGDVSGKGIPAAMLMSHLQSSFQLITHDNVSLEDVAYRLNNLIYRNSTPEMFITCFLGILDASQNVFSFINAGHDIPVFLHNGKAHGLKTGGLLFGVKPEVDYDIAEVKLNHGDLIVLYSDGITEAMNEDETEFGRDRLIESIQDYKEKPAKDILNGIINDTLKFADEQRPVQDDMTIVVVKSK
ncbi:MAG: SpoIIE family protein phosphatase [Candidatus Electryonea clarkiae]|nr:SpoIIE family protein phosphatase [Candidatus Electryonea clarkiae]MDP8287464.1 SpoIIE family protein phosphatase [Candidatus Electryonea clarkiae]